MIEEEKGDCGMWTCKEMKMKALGALQKSYGYCVLVTLAVNAVYMLVNRLTINVSVPITLNFEELIKNIQQNYSLYLVTSIASVISNLAFTIFLFQVLSVGEYFFYINADRGIISYKNLLYPFSSRRYMNIVKVKALKFIRVLLWSLLFVIPGIVKEYEYFFVDMILCDNPHVPASKALRMSSLMTKGHKGHIFLLQLSFLGWQLLGLLLCGAGVIFVNPYIYETNVKLYYHLKNEALMNGQILPEDFMPRQETAM